LNINTTRKYHFFYQQGCCRFLSERQVLKPTFLIPSQERGIVAPGKSAAVIP
jgi:hypothetical protein